MTLDELTPREPEVKSVRPWQKTQAVMMDSSIN